jgi:hypothetical protein
MHVQYRLCSAPNVVNSFYPKREKEGWEEKIRKGLVRKIRQDKERWKDCAGKVR